MDAEYGLLLDLVVALAIALVGGWIATRAGLSAMVGYVAAGLVISPFTPGFVGDTERLRLIADIGVVLLMFGIGVQFSPRELAAAGARTLAASFAQVAAVTLAGLGMGLLIGWDWREALFAGAALSLSSSMLVVKLLDESGGIRLPHGRLAVSWAIGQDLASLVLVAVLISISGEGNLAVDAAIAAVAAFGFVGGMLLFGLRGVPWVLGKVSDLGSRELFVLSVAALALGTALASEWAGLSLALGAFLAGLVVSESDLAHRVLGELMPARDVFGVLFFVSVGMLIDPEAIGGAIPTFAALLVMLVVLKGALIALLARVAGHRTETALAGGAILAQGGEFSFVVVGIGLDEAVVREDVFTLLVASAAVSMAATPLFVRLIGRAREALEGRRNVPEEGLGVAPLGRRAIICGFGETGRLVASVLARRFEILVIEQNPRVARGAPADVPMLIGDAANPFTLRRADVMDCRVLIVTVPDAITARLITERARQLHPALDVIARAPTPGEAARLRALGASETVVAEREVALEMIRHSMHRFGVDQRQALAIVQRMRVT